MCPTVFAFPWYFCSIISHEFSFHIDLTRNVNSKWNDQNGMSKLVCRQTHARIINFFFLYLDDRALCIITIKSLKRTKDIKLIDTCLSRKKNRHFLMMTSVNPKKVADKVTTFPHNVKNGTEWLVVAMEYILISCVFVYKNVPQSNMGCDNRNMKREILSYCQKHIFIVPKFLIKRMTMTNLNWTRFWFVRTFFL